MVKYRSIQRHLGKKDGILYGGAINYIEDWWNTIIKQNVTVHIPEERS